MIFPNTAAAPRRRLDRLLRCLVTRHRRAVDQGVLVRVGQGPGADGAAGREPPAGVVLPRARRPGLLHRRADRVVAVDDQGGQQVVLAREVAVDGGGDHPHLLRDRAQRQLGGALGGQMPLGGLGDLPDQLGADPLPRGTARIHGHRISEHRSLNESTARINPARRAPPSASLCVPPPDDEERDRDQRGGEGHEDAGLDELEGPEPVARLVGRERAVTEARHACECGAYLAFDLLA